MSCCSQRRTAKVVKRLLPCDPAVTALLALSSLLVRGHWTEHGVVAPQGPANVKGLAEAIESETTPLPLLVVELSRVLLDQIDGLSKKVAELEKTTVQEAARAATMRRLQTMPGVGPITAMAIETFAPPMPVFRRGRDSAAWLGLVPRQHSTGAKPLLGKTSKMGQRDIRHLARWR